MSSQAGDNDLCTA